MKGGTSPPKRDHKLFSRSSRRRSVRRSALPRPRTIGVPSVVLVNTGGVTTVDNEAVREARSPTMNFYPPTGGIPTDFKAPPGLSASELAMALSPALKSKKKLSLFGSLRTKERSNSITSTDSPLATSPLPMGTPCKAARLLGLSTDASSTSSVNSESSPNQDGRLRSGATARPAMPRQSSVPLLMRMKGKVREETTTVDQPEVNKKSRKGDNKKALELLDLSPAQPGSSGGRFEGHALNPPPSSRFEKVANSPRGNENETRNRVDRITAPYRPDPEPRRRKKGPKSLERMSPITEASHGDLNTAYRNSEHNTELDVISEYEYDYPPHGAYLLPRSLPESLLTPVARYESLDIRYELRDDDLSPTDLAMEEEQYSDDEIELDTPHPGERVKIDEAKWPTTTDLHLRGPLQSLEHQYLDAAEKNIRKNKKTADQLDACRALCDQEVSQLKESHEEMKNEFTMLTIPPKNPRRQQRLCADALKTPDDDLVSICSSIDSDEGISIHVAEIQGLTRVVPGTVKLVDIPLRKRGTRQVMPPAVRVQSTPRITVSNFCIDCNEEIDVQNDIAENFEVTTAPPSRPRQLTRMQPMLPSKLFEATPYERFTRSENTRVQSKESRRYTQDWVSNSPHPSEQQAMGEALDKKPSSGFRSPPTPPPKDAPVGNSNAGKHFCIKNGHLFYPIDVAKVANQVSLNALEVRPYFVNANGKKQAVKVPVRCEKCDKDTKGHPWECGVPVCRLTVCTQCARDMDEEWQERAAGEWQY